MKKCGCFELDKKKFKLETILGKLETIGATNWRDGLICNDEEFTKLLQCNDCDDYFLLDKKEAYLPLSSKIRLERYETNLERKYMKMIFRNLDKGIASRETLNYLVKSVKFIKGK